MVLPSAFTWTTLAQAAGVTFSVHLPHTKLPLMVTSLSSARAFPIRARVRTTPKPSSIEHVALISHPPCKNLLPISRIGWPCERHVRCSVAIKRKYTVVAQARQGNQLPALARDRSEEHTSELQSL